MFGHWLADVFSYPSWSILLAIVAKTAIIYVFVVVALRLLGARALGRMSAYDFVLIVVVANSVQNALVGGDNTLVGGLVSAFALLVMNQLYTWLLNRFPALEKQMVGEPVVLISNGDLQRDCCEREGITSGELMAALREHGVADLNDVRLAVLEVDGTISVVPAESQVHRTHRRFRGRGAT
jgi:uncharacterized membrane protein YcaP (DUF421 family)